MKPRNGELTTVIDREVFEVFPPDCRIAEDRRRWTAFRRSYDRARRLEIVPEFPLQIDFALNSTCQMQCTFCVHENRRPYPPRELEFKLFRKAIDEGTRYGLCSVKLNYINEPLLRRDFADFVGYAKRRGILNIYFATNGLCLIRMISRELIHAGVTKVMVSLDAVSPETFRRVRRSDRFDEIVENVLGLLDVRRELRSSLPLVRVNFLRTKENEHELEAFVERWRGVADSIGIQEQVGRPGETDEFAPAPANFRCSFPFKLVVVDSDGEILPCCTFGGREMPLGNITSSTILEAWTSNRMLGLRSLHRQERGTWNPTCAHCLGADL